jgi:tetratricopeptide (TPR) repeat protein
VDWFHEIRERRIVPAIGVYIGASWVVVEILDRLVERYLLSPYITDIAFWGLYSMLPAVMLIAWTHGKPGKDKATAAEKVGVPVNIIATMGLLISIFGGKDLGAAADLVTVSNELGQQEEHIVPRDSYRRRVGVFFFDKQGGDPEQDWLQYGVTDLLVQDMQQNPFMLVTSPWSHRGHGFYARMKQAGFDDGLGLPLNLMRDIARRANRQYFIEGDVDSSGDQFQVTARIWETESLTMLGELSEQGWSLLPVVDKITNGLKSVLDVPGSSNRLAEDLPLAETYGESADAHKSYIKAMNAVLFDNDWEQSNRYFDEALAEDPGFVLAWFMKGVHQFEQGNIPSAQASLAEAQKLDFRLPERDRVLLKGYNYRISGEQEKLEAFLRLQIRLRGDAESHRTLASFLMVTGRLDEAKQAYREAMALDEADLAALLNLAVLDRSTGDLESAIENASRYHEERPDNVTGLLLLGDLKLDLGDMEAASLHYEQAQLLENPPLAPILRLTQVAARKGEWARARELIQEAQLIAATPAQHRAVLQTEGLLAVRRGQLRYALELLELQSEYDRQIQAPVEQVFAYFTPLVEYSLLLGEIPAAEAALEAARGLLEPPMDQFLSFSEASIRARQGSFDQAQAALDQGREVIDRFKADYLQYAVSIIEGLIASEQQDWSSAARHLERAIADAERSIVGGDMRYRLPVLYGECAEMHVKAGELDLAQQVLDTAFRRDPYEPSLWYARALLQRANGSVRMADASINYALAIWGDADPEYIEYQEAIALRSQIEAEVASR